MAAVTLVAMLLGGGCSSPKASVPRLDPAAAARLALAEYDLNKDGALDAKELDRCPALKGSLKRIDKNGDGRLSSQELEERFKTYAAEPAGLLAFGCQVLLDGQPLPGAAVRFVPEKFLGPTYQLIVGVTNEEGQIEGQPGFGMYAGLYRIEVSRTNTQGQETVPARYNTQTVLGEEIAPDTLGRGGDLIIRVTSR